MPTARVCRRACTSSICGGLFLHNDLAEGRFQVAGRPLALDDIKLPMFVVGTERDHIAPWRSVFKLHLLNDGELTFVLTSGGHNAGIVSEPGHPHRHFRIRVREAGGRTLGPDEWEHDTRPARWILVAGVGRMARPPFRYAGRSANDGRAQLAAAL